VLANMALNGLETRLRERFPIKGKGSFHGKPAKVHIVRFADDFIITGASKELLEQDILPLVERFFAERGLHLSPTKTVITRITDGFDFLGQNIRKYDGKLLIKPSRKSIHSVLTEVRAIIRANKQATAGHLIFLLNPLIRGWAEYHRHVVSKVVFSKVDTAIFHALWHWATRRHPTKGSGWVKHKYFPPFRGQHWLFQGMSDGRGQPPHPVRLFQATSVPIRRHIKIRSDANPYDPAWEQYFEQRFMARMRATKDKGGEMSLWKDQQGLCPVCHQRLALDQGWHSHHIVWKSHGGSDSQDNRVLLHPNCHRQVHSRKLTVTKPRPAQGVGTA
jgi:RNA-directed DNA polymerase